jgi:prephenate dehydratase
LEKALHQQQAIGAKEMVIIGHPKALTRYGLKALKEFILKNHKKHNFTTFIQEKNTF